MARLNLSELINTRAVAGEVRVGEEQDVAVDAFGGWAAVFRFAVSSDGEMHVETELAERRSDSGWTSVSIGGVSIPESERPWVRRTTPWPEGHLYSLGWSGVEVHPDDGTTQEVIGICGFATEAVKEIHVSDASGDHAIAPAPTGAFIAVALGSGSNFAALHPLGDDGPLGAPLRLPTL